MIKMEIFALEFALVKSRRLMAMDVNNGRIIAMQGGFSYESWFLIVPLKQKAKPGSSFKPFVAGISFR